MQTEAFVTGTRQALGLAKTRIAATWRFATIHFLLIMLLINLIQTIFGPQNAVIGLIAAPLMLVLSQRDLTAHPFRHLCGQALLLCLMVTVTSVSTRLPIRLAFVVHLLTLFTILYLHTYEYGQHLYFQYILGYLFLLFLSPIEPAGLPMRLLATVFGSACLILYQLVKGRSRINQTTQDVFCTLLDEAGRHIKALCDGRVPTRDHHLVSDALGRLSRTLDQRRKGALCLSEAGFTALEVGRSLRELDRLLVGCTPDPTSAAFLAAAREELAGFRAFICRERDALPAVGWMFCENETAGQLRRILDRIRQLLPALATPERRKRFQKTALPLSARLRTALAPSRMRLTYALRVSCLLAVGILLVQQFSLAHGKWMLFTIASVSLPYADDVGKKAKLRMLATIMGGLASVLLFSMIPSAVGRMLVAMLAGYLSFYVTGYQWMFSLGTIGALGSAMSAGAVGLGAIGPIVLIRLGYVMSAE